MWDLGSDDSWTKRLDASGANPPIIETISKLPKSHPRQWVDRSYSAYTERPIDCFAKSHPRQWVDCSYSAYTERPMTPSRIPPTGSGWIVQAQPRPGHTRYSRSSGPSLPL